MILFLNKVDLLERKLSSGVKVKEYLPSYGDRPNDLSTVVRCEFSLFFHFFVSFDIYIYLPL